MALRTIVIGGLAALVASISVGAAGADAYAVHIDPKSFGTHIDNQWFPLVPGTAFVYEDQQGTRDVMTVTRRTRTLDGVRCRIVHDYVYSAGRPSERTSDYYAQDKRGNVWYFGEDAFDTDAHGRFKKSPDTWHAGIGGALPGLFMPPHPRVHERHYQEYFKGHAEDQFAVASITAAVAVPYGSFTGVVETREFSRLEPGVIDRDYYVRGLGQVLERAGAGGNSALVQITRQGN
jgi:hypothetical protein